MEKYPVILEKPHTHNGKLCPVGDEIEVTLLEAEFLAERRVIKKIPSKTAIKKTLKEE